jgi:enterochelin esterase-like enzyme
MGADAVIFRLADPEGELAGVWLLPALSLPPDTGLGFDRVDGGWALRLPRPPVWRMEYRFGLRYPDGGTEEVCDPGNPLRAPGAFGDKSVLALPEYEPPAWLSASVPDGHLTELAVPARALGCEIAIQLWAPQDAPPAEPLPLLVAHDGPEYDRLASLTGYSTAMIASGRLPRHRVALLQPGERNDEYSANPAYAHALAINVLPALREAVAVHGHAVGMGASLGGLAMLHAQRRYPGRFAGLFLQSASFLDRRLDPQEARRFGRFNRVSRFVGETKRLTARAQRVPVVLTCGVAEENLANNRQMAAALHEQGYPVRLDEVPDAHNYVAWRDAFDPALTDLLAALWTRPHCGSDDEA